MEQKDVLKALQRDHAAELKLAAERLSGTAKHTEIIPSPVLSEMTGHTVGGVCPFANPEGVRTYLDVSLKRFGTVFPAAGSSNSAIELTCDELTEYSHCEGWIDVCKGWQTEDSGV